MSWAGIVAAPLCLIGEVYRDDMDLAMDPAGRVYAGEGSLVLLLGDSGKDAIEGLCVSRETVTIPKPTPTDYLVHFVLYAPDGTYLASSDSDVFTVPS